MKLLLFCALPLLSLALRAQTVTTLTLDERSGGYNSQAIVNGHPAISYYDGAAKRQKYIRANDANGMSWGPPVTVGGPSFVDGYASLAVVDGHPAISYLSYNADGFRLKYVRATDPHGASWGTPLTMPSTAIARQETSLVVVDGYPAISYQDYSKRDVKYVRANDARGTGWGTPVTVDSAGDVGWCISMAVVDGRPAISYHDRTNGDLKYVRASDTSGTNWGTAVTVGSTAPSADQDSSLAVVNGHPAISYQFSRYFSNVSQQWVYGDVKYVRASDTTGANWGTPVVVASTWGQSTSLAVVNGNPAFSYHDGVNGDLKYARASDANGTNWSTPVTLDSTGSVGEYNSLVVVNGHPAISYYDRTNGDLKWAIYGPAPDIQVEAPLGQVRLSGGLPLNFDQQPVEGGLIIGVTHRVTNTGPGTLTGLVATIVGAAPGDFTLSALPPATLAPGASFQFDVRFDPTAPGERTATLTLTSNDPGEIPFLVPLKGTGLTAQEAWRLQYFVTIGDTGDAANTADPDGDGDDNLFEFVAGLVPTDPASRFLLRAEPVAGQPEQKAVVFSPVLAGRTYEVKSKADLSDPAWEPLGSFTTSDNGSERTVIDRGAGAGPRFYILEIVRP